MKITNKLASGLVRRMAHGLTLDQAREFIDQDTKGELDPWQLDTLTEWTLKAQELVRAYDAMTNRVVPDRHQNAKIIPFPLKPEVR